MGSKILDKSFFERDTRVVAVELIGKVLAFESENTLLKGEIVETEAYLGSKDPASHAFPGVRPRNKVMFGPPAVSYVYFTYGFHHCFNVVTEQEGVPGAVLIRALKPLAGIEIMKKRRIQAKTLEGLTNGPGKLAQAFGLTREHSGLELTKSGFHFEEGENIPIEWIGVSPRIGIREARDSMYRFYKKNSLFVSKSFELK